MSKTGVLLIDKAQGVTSAAVVAKVKRQLGLRRGDRVGHAGTLDPMATGLLICLIGGATKLASHYSHKIKTYVGTIQLGITTATDDIEGEILEKSERELPFVSDLEHIQQQFMGAILQVPPRVSAVHVNGKRAYARARAGEEFALSSKEVFVEKLTFAPGKSPGEIKFVVSCGSGFYVRSLARDIGEHFGVGGCLSALRRTHSGDFVVDNASRVEDVNEDSLESWEIAVQSFPQLDLSNRQLAALASGKRHESDPALEIASSRFRRESDKRAAQSLFRFASLEGEKLLQGVVQRPENGKWKVLFWDPYLRSKCIEKQAV